MSTPLSTKKKNPQNSIRLGVNIDHAATLRQVRGGTTSYPSLLEICKSLKKTGAQQITLHLREDRRHIQDSDVATLLKNKALKKIDINLEIAVTVEMLAIALKHKPDWVCFVPEKRQELTTEGGLNAVKLSATLKKMIPILQKKDIKVSLFIEPAIDQVLAAREVGADAIELHTGKWVLLSGKNKQAEWQRLEQAATVANDLDLFVHAGHGLDYEHTKKICKLSHLREVNIGHSMICYSLIEGLEPTTKKMLHILSTAKSSKSVKLNQLNKLKKYKK